MIKSFMPVVILILSLFCTILIMLVLMLMHILIRRQIPALISTLWIDAKYYNGQWLTLQCQFGHRNSCNFDDVVQVIK